MINRGKGAVRAPYWSTSVPPVNASDGPGRSEQEHQLTGPQKLVGCILHALNVCIVGMQDVIISFGFVLKSY